MKFLVFGEILFDVFDGKAVLGGAPYNFAAHAQKLGAQSVMVSAVGDDAYGKQALSELERRGMSPQFVATVPNPTGYCDVTLVDGKPSYQLVRDVAYDRIPMPALGAERYDALYFGTLAQRDSFSRTTLKRLLAGHPAQEVFFDINIRQSFWTREILDAGVSAATILKISREEMSVFGDNTVEGLCRSLPLLYENLRYILVTLDKDGAYLYDCRNGSGLYSPRPVNRPVSTVGAGDSFSAAFLVDLLQGKTPETCLADAVALSDFVVTRLEAVPD